MKTIKELHSMDISWLKWELINAKKKFVSLKFSSDLVNAKKYRKYVARIKTVINIKNKSK